MAEVPWRSQYLHMLRSCSAPCHNRGLERRHKWRATSTCGTATRQGQQWQLAASHVSQRRQSGCFDPRAKGSALRAETDWTVHAVRPQQACFQTARPRRRPSRTVASRLRAECSCLPQTKAGWTPGCWRRARCVRPQRPERLLELATTAQADPWPGQRLHQVGRDPRCSYRAPGRLGATQGRCAT